MNESIKIILDWIASFEETFLGVQSSINKQIRGVEAALLRRILADVLPALKIENGALYTGISNIAKANLIDRVFDELGRDEMSRVLLQYADNLLNVSGQNAGYYFAAGFDKKKVKAIASDLTFIRSVIGITKDGGLTKDGFLYRLGRTDAVREQVKQYVVSSVMSGKSLADFQSGISGILSKKDGALSSYWNNYAYDAYSRVREVSNLHFKNELGLRYFVYQGGLIKTSRTFCIKKNGKAFSEDEAKKNWPKDPDLIDKKNKSYNPIIDRGRHNCRHFIMWISEEKYNELKGKA